MRRVVKRVVKSVTTVTWTIQWDEEVADGNPPIRQTAASVPEEERLAPSESQPSAKMLEPAKSSDQAIYKPNSSLDQGENP